MIIQPKLQSKTQTEWNAESRKQPLLGVTP